MSGSDSELSDLGPEYDDGDEVMQPSSDDDEDVEMDQGMMSEGDNDESAFSWARKGLAKWSNEYADCYDCCRRLRRRGDFGRR